MEDFEKLFRQDVLEKKKAGRGIFSRVSTRKGGTNQALRTPYLFMSAKERKSLNGEVRSYNMNNILKWNAFNQLKDDRQKELLAYWREKNAVSEIAEGMGVSKGTVYNRFNKLGVDPNKGIKTVGDKVKNREALSQEELEEILQSNTLIEFLRFKSIDREQQFIILNSYMENGEYKSLSDLSKRWQDSDLKYIYNTNSAYKNYLKKKSNLKPKEKENPPTSKIDNPDNQDNQDNDKSSTDTAVVTQLPEAIVEIPVKVDAVTNGFYFTLNGRYSPQTIARRLRWIEEDLLESDEQLEINIVIRGVKK